MSRIIAFSPVHSDLPRFEPCVKAVRALRGLDELWLWDDQNGVEVRRRIFELADRRFASLAAGNAGYKIDAVTHTWTNEAVDRVAGMKDAVIMTFLHTDASHLLLIDSDICPPPTLLNVLLAANKPIVSEVFWTRWEPKFFIAPQVWEFSPYGFLSPEWITRLREPGLYEVGGLGACTLVERRVLEAGVNFSRVAGLPGSWGEDRSFCVRAAVAGFPLWASVGATPFHVYRESQLPELHEWLTEGTSLSWFRDRWLGARWKSEVYASFGRAIPKEEAA